MIVEPRGNLTSRSVSLAGNNQALAQTPVRNSERKVGDWPGRWRRLRTSLALAPLGLLAVSLCLWVVSVGQTNISAIGELGLVTVLPWTYAAAFVVLTIGFCLALRLEPIRTPLMVLFIFVSVIILYGTPSLLEQMPRGITVYRHLGVGDFLAIHLVPNQDLDAYFSWPGFFYMLAAVTKLGGLNASLQMARWAPLVLNLLYLAPLVTILRVASRDNRLVWLAVWLYYLTNWVGQDYLSPQGFAYFLMLVILAILLKWFKVGRPLFSEGLPAETSGRGPIAFLKSLRHLPQPETPNPEASPAKKAWLLIAVVLLFIIVTSSHQLTPFALIFDVSALVLFSRLQPRSLPALMVVTVACWWSFMAAEFFAGHVSMITGGLGDIRGNLGVNVANRLTGNPAHLLVVRFRLIMTVAIWFMAGLGAIRRLRAGRLDLSLGLLAVAPFFLLAETYGGEMILRVYFFALPAMAFFAAALFFVKRRSSTSIRKLSAIGLCSCLLFAGFLATRYGNEDSDYISRAEFDGSLKLYALAPPGSALLTVTSAPLRFMNYDTYAYEDIRNELNILETADVDGLADSARAVSAGGTRPVFVFFTRSQSAQVDLFSGLPRGTMTRLAAGLEASSKFKVMYYGTDAEIFQLTDVIKPSGESQPSDTEPSNNDAATSQSNNDGGTSLSSATLPPVALSTTARRPLSSTAIPTGPRTTALTDASAVAAFGSVRAWAAAHNAEIAAGAPGNSVDPETGM